MMHLESFDKTWFLRLAMAAVFLYHGSTKDLAEFSEKFSLPTLVAIAVIVAELAGGLGYLAGGLTYQKYFGQTLTQWAALATIPVSLGAIYLVHAKNGFSVMNGGYEFHLVLISVAMYLYLL